jgi:DNA repair protein RadA/Sms
MALAKTRSMYVCQKCGRQSPRHMGRCPGCGQFNTMVEEVFDTGRVGGLPRNRVVLANTQPQPLDVIAAQDHPRMLVPLAEFNRVLGGGIVPGSITLIGGEPGIGKSTLLIQVSCLIAGHVGKRACRKSRCVPNGWACAATSFSW